MILNRYERTVARRYLLPGKGEGFIFLVASISLFAVALGVAALIIVMSVMNGFRAELFDKITGLNGHAIVQGYEGRLTDWQRISDAARKVPGVTSATPLIEQPLMASANGRVEAVFLRGMRLSDLRNNAVIANHGHQTPERTTFGHEWSGMAIHNPFGDASYGDWNVVDQGDGRIVVADPWTVWGFEYIAWRDERASGVLAARAAPVARRVSGSATGRGEW